MTYNYIWVEGSIEELKTKMSEIFTNPTKDIPWDIRWEMPRWHIEVVGNTSWWRQIDTGSGWVDVELQETGEILLTTSYMPEEIHNQILTLLNPDRWYPPYEIDNWSTF